MLILRPSRDCCDADLSPGGPAATRAAVPAPTVRVHTPAPCGKDAA